jgi:hypothetical protein
MNFRKPKKIGSSDTPLDKAEPDDKEVHITASIGWGR